MLDSNWRVAVLVVVVAMTSFFATLHLLQDEMKVGVRAETFTYNPPEINGRRVEVTPADWDPNITPLKTAIRQTADIYCRKLGHRRAANYAYVPNQPAGAERFVGPNDTRTIFCDFCRSNFTQVVCEK